MGSGAASFLGGISNLFTYSKGKVIQNIGFYQWAHGAKSSQDRVGDCSTALKKITNKRVWILHWIYYTQLIS